MTASSNFGNVFSVLIASVFLPFLPMMAIHLLIQNLLYDISQLSIPWAAVGLRPLPLAYFPWLVAILLGYCTLTQIVKRWYVRRFDAWL